MSYQKHTGAVRRFARLIKFSNWLQALPNKLTPPPFRLIQIGSAFWQSRILYVAARLDIASQLGDATLPATEIAAGIGANPDATYRLLRMLAAMGIFEQTSPHEFRNNRLSACLRTDNPQSVRAMILMHNDDVMCRPWFEQLERGVREGEPPFRLSHGDDLFAYLDRHPDFDKLFSEAMDSVEALTGDSFATDFDWGRFDRIIDVGGSRGSKSLAILKQHPQMQALVIDRPQVIDEAEQYWRCHQAAGTDRLRFEAGDLFDSVPPAQNDRDIYLVSAVLHSFDDETCITGLRNLAKACGNSDARIALLEMVLPETGADPAGASFDMQMFMASRGRERTLNEWTDLFKHSGLALEEVVGLRSFGNILVLGTSTPARIRE